MAADDISWKPALPAGHTEFSWRRPRRGHGNAGAQAPSAASGVAAEAPAAAAAAAGGGAGGAGGAAAERVGARRVPLPVPGQRNILVTSALPYVNNVPHLGNIIGCVLSADVYARFCRLRGYNTVYVCGTDEYGTTTENKALEIGVSPQEICDKYHAVHRDIYAWFDISFDIFGRTSTPNQTRIAQDIFVKNDRNGNIQEGELQQLWCDSCKRFLADRFVEGVCPKCGFADARGDQCDSCGSVLDPAELIKPRCKQCKNTPEMRATRHLFLDLPKLQPRLEAWIKEASVRGAWSQNSISTTQSWIRDGLKSRCITRDLKWGIPVPRPGFENKVFYVWYDAPIGYISILSCLTDEWERWWKNPRDVELVQFMGKDNIPFHTVMFPSCLIGSDDGYTLLHHISTTEYLNYENSKFSKSRGTGVFGDDAKTTGVPAEVWRFYLLINRPEVSDTVFSWSDFAAKLNGELVNNLGNFINRALSFCAAHFAGVVQPLKDALLAGADKETVASVQRLLDSYVRDLEAVHIKDALRTVLEISHLGNQYVQDNQPWVLIKGDAAQRERCGHVNSLAVHLVYLLAVLLEPFMPSVSRKVCAQLNVDAAALSLRVASAARADVPQFPALRRLDGTRIGAPAVLFQKMSDEEAVELRARFGGKKDDAKAPEFPLRLVVGVVSDVHQHENAEAKHLYVLTVDAGEGGGGARQIVSALQPFYQPAELRGRRVLVATNIKASNFKGVKSNGMILTAEGPDKRLAIVTVPDAVAIGTVVLPRGFQAAPSKTFNPKTDLAALALRVGPRSAVVAGPGAAPLMPANAPDQHAAMADRGLPEGSDVH
jgi:methionyl-tRNA synthetase